MPTQSTIRGAALLDELIALAARRGLSVRREALARGVTGGLCVLKGVPTVFLDDRAALDAQLEVLASVLRRLDWSTVFVPPAFRAVLGAVGEPDEPPTESAPASAPVAIERAPDAVKRAPSRRSRRARA